MKDEFNEAFIELSKDEGVTVWHVSIYMDILFRL